MSNPGGGPAGAGGVSSDDDGRFKELVKRFSPVSAVIARHDDELLHKVQVVSKAYMKQSVLSKLQAAGQRPVLMVYGSDLSPMIVRFRAATRVNERWEIREGGQGC